MLQHVVHKYQLVLSLSPGRYYCYNTFHYSFNNSWHEEVLRGTS